MQGGTTRNFQDKGGFMKLRHFDNHFVKNTRKKRLRREKFWSFFLLDTLKIAFWMENLNQRWTQSWYLFNFQKKEVKAFPHHLVTRLTNLSFSMMIQYCFYRLDIVFFEIIRMISYYTETATKTKFRRKFVSKKYI